jgi:serine/threonine protein kinase
MENEKKILKKSPTVSKGLDKESEKSDFTAEQKDHLILGCYGKVSSVAHKRTARPYGIKVLYKQIIKEKGLGEEIDNIISQMYRIESPFFLRVLNHFEDNDNIFLILQSVNYSKGCLKERVKDLKEEEILIFFKQIVTGVNYLHSKNIFGRDINPLNVFFDYEDGVKMTDYGWSDITNQRNKNKKPTILNLTQMSRSNILYTAPEVLLGNLVSKDSDIWVLGVMLFELISKGESLFLGDGENLKNNILGLKMNPLINRINPQIKTLIESMIKFNPQDRLNLNLILTSPLISPLKCDFSKYDPDESIINKLTPYISPQEQLITKLKKEIEILKKDNENLKKNSQDLKIENSTLKEKMNQTLLQSNSSVMDISSNEGEDTSFMFLEGKMKFEYVNKDRLAKSQELEEKANEILEYRSRIRLLENELELSNMNTEELKERNDNLENEIKSLTQQLESEKQEKESKIQTLNNKLELLQNKLFSSRESVMGSNSEESLKNISVLLLDLVKEFNEATQKLLLRSKDENESLMKNLRDTLSTKEESLKECYFRTKEALDVELIRFSSRTSLQKETSNPNHKLNWLMMQVKELSPYKQKYSNLKDSEKRYVDEIESLNSKLKLMQIDLDTNKGMLREIEDTLKTKAKYTTGLEDKLSDVKGFLLNNFSSQMDKVEELFLTYKI